MQELSIVTTSGLDIGISGYYSKPGLTDVLIGGKVNERANPSCYSWFGGTPEQGWLTPDPTINHAQSSSNPSKNFNCIRT